MSVLSVTMICKSPEIVLYLLLLRIFLYITNILLSKRVSQIIYSLLYYSIKLRVTDFILSAVCTFIAVLCSDGIQWGI